MATTKEITEMCKEGKVQEAYEIAKAEVTKSPGNVWAQRSVGWALYYMIKNDATRGDYNQLLKDIDELKSLDLLTMANDSMIFENVEFQIANFIKHHVSLSDIQASAKLSTFFFKLKDYTFKPSKGHSFLLQSIIKFDNWSEMADFFDWWDLDNLSQEDYTPYETQKGQKIMTLAERAFIAKSKELLKLRDLSRIELFLPKLDALMNDHQEMMYPGYFYGKLLLALGSDADEALKVIIPFARKKATEFWVWQLLSDVFAHDEDKQLACLLRAVHCRTQENFLGKVRLKLAQLYIKNGLYNKARYHINALTRCYTSNGWHLPHEIDNFIHQPWFDSTVPDNVDSIDYKTITDGILCDGAEECIAVVTNVNPVNNIISMIYGFEKRTAQKLRFKVQAGNILKLHYINNPDGRIRILSANKAQLPEALNYAKTVVGNIVKREDKDFAFLNCGDDRCFVSPTIVRKYNLTNGVTVKALIVYDYNKKKEEWNWTCTDIKK